MNPLSRFPEYAQKAASSFPAPPYDAGYLAPGPQVAKPPEGASPETITMVLQGAFSMLLEAHKTIIELYGRVGIMEQQPEKPPAATTGENAREGLASLALAIHASAKALAFRLPPLVERL